MLAGHHLWLFPTRLYHPALAGTPPEEGNWNHLGLRSRRGSTTYIPVGVGRLFPTPL